MQYPRRWFDQFLRNLLICRGALLQDLENAQAQRVRESPQLLRVADLEQRGFVWHNLSASTY
jgi:hypothetical protein